ncbi:MAG: glycosyltransferase family 2 protein [Bacteroidia bacterium]|nr:glycosyltransferase family 2 protein [Bacteroidia bacterium]
MPAISVVIITFNEERNIGRCLDSVKEIADEIIVVDSFSTDKTEEICNSYKVRFFKHEFDGYSNQKNWGNTQAVHPYILSIDADEALSEKLVAEIKKIKSAWTHDAYCFNRITNYCGKWINHCGWYPDRKLRLWDKRRGQWNGALIHEDVEMAADARKININADILHYSYYSITGHIAQVNRFTDLTATDAFNKGEKASLFKIFFKPIWKFKRDFIFKLGFLDGYYGFVVCFISAFAAFLKYAKLRQLQKEKIHQQQ